MPHCSAASTIDAWIGSGSKSLRMLTVPGPDGSRRSMRSYTGSTSRHDQPSAPRYAHVSKSAGAPRTQTMALRQLEPPSTRPRGHASRRPAACVWGTVSKAQSSSASQSS